MAISIGMHTETGRPIFVETRIYTGEKPFAVAEIRVNDTDKMSVFFHDIESVETMAFQLAALAVELREDHGWTANTNIHS